MNRGKPAKILVVDDEYSVRDSLSQWFKKDGFDVSVAENANAALGQCQNESFDLALLDIRMPGMDGLELQKRLKSLDPGLTTIMITAFASVETAVEALKEGAFDYITKPVDPDELSHLVQKALEQKRLQDENTQLKERIDDLVQTNQIIAESPGMKKVIEMVENVARTDSTVFIRGESGTGKEIIARAIHYSSQRKYFPIVPVNCGALTETLLESELFGHERGAFTGAQARRKGKLEMADGGTLFLDEIGTIGLKTQVDLLRALESKEFTRVGGSKSIKVDFRVICATNQNLEELVKQDLFREDLYYRLNVFTISLPPLRERREDIPLLANHFLKKLNMQMDKKISQISPDAMDRLVRYRWPGNVRELSNAIERAMVVGSAPAIQSTDLPFLLEEEKTGAPVDSLADMERRHIINILRKTGWNVTKSAEILQIDRVTLYNKMKKYDLKREA